MGKRCVILDRDGTINKEQDYLSDPEELELLQGTIEGLKLLKELALSLIIVTNQSGIGRGYFDWNTATIINDKLCKMLEKEGVHIDGIYVCPHRPEDNCLCRKPNPGLIDKAARELGFDPRKSYLIGDKACDIDLAKNVGAKSFLVRTGYGKLHEEDEHLKPDYIVDNVKQAAEVIQSLSGKNNVSAQSLL